MSKRARNAFVVLFTLGLVAVTGAAASARGLSSSESTFKMKWRLMRFQEAGGISAECAVTLEGVFHSMSIQKTRSILIGFIDGATMGTCAANEAGWLRETLPWHIQHESWTGTLPAINRWNWQINEVSFWVKNGIFGSRCLARARATELFKLGIQREPTEGYMREVIPTESAITTSCSTSIFPSRLREGEMVSFVHDPARIRLTLI